MAFTKKQVERQYKKLLANTKEKRESYLQKATVYKCINCHKIEKAVKRDLGGSPRIVVCSCGGLLHDQMSDDFPEIKPTVTYYLPSLKECIKLKEHEALLGHIFRGGLIHLKK